MGGVASVSPSTRYLRLCREHVEQHVPSVIQPSLNTNASIPFIFSSATFLYLVSQGRLSRFVHIEQEPPPPLTMDHQPAKRRVFGALNANANLTPRPSPLSKTTFPSSTTTSPVKAKSPLKRSIAVVMDATPKRARVEVRHDGMCGIGCSREARLTMYMCRMTRWHVRELARRMRAVSLTRV